MLVIEKPSKINPMQFAAYGYAQLIAAGECVVEYSDKSARITNMTMNADGSFDLDTIPNPDLVQQGLVDANSFNGHLFNSERETEFVVTWKHVQTTTEMELARLQREIDELTRENKRLGEIQYILRISNIAQNALARCVTVTDIEARGIARRAQKDIKKVNQEWMAAFPVNTQVMEVETY